VTATSPTGLSLRDGRAVVVRVLGGEDSEALERFGARLREDDWRYLDIDLQNPATVERLVRAHEAANWRQLVADAEGELVGYANVRQLAGWKNHVGDIHLVVGEDARGSGLGTALARAVVEAGRELGVAKLMLQMLVEQSAGRTIFDHLGFRQEGVLVRHARDAEGTDHDLLILGLLLDEG
jgi:RimJ/RimL family protein N-acetyltransferase